MKPSGTHVRMRSRPRKSSLKLQPRSGKTNDQKVIWRRSAAKAAGHLITKTKAMPSSTWYIETRIFTFGSNSTASRLPCFAAFSDIRESRSNRGAVLMKKGIRAKNATHAAMRGYPSTSSSGELCSHGTHSFPAR